MNVGKSSLRLLCLSQIFCQINLSQQRQQYIFFKSQVSRSMLQIGSRDAAKAKRSACEGQMHAWARRRIMMPQIAMRHLFGHLVSTVLLRSMIGLWSGRTVPLAFPLLLSSLECSSTLRSRLGSCYSSSLTPNFKDRLWPRSFLSSSSPFNFSLWLF